MDDNARSVVGQSLAFKAQDKKKAAVSFADVFVSLG
jgi:hypothetical protein